MGWVVAGTREKVYRVRTPDEVSAWVADAIDAMTQGWVPLASEPVSDGSVRAIYGKVCEPGDVGRARTSGAPVVQRPPDAAARWGALVALLALLAVLTMVAAFAEP